MISPRDKRAVSIIRQSIEKLRVNLGGKFNVMTEVGSGLYTYTPIIAAMAGARKVYACTRDSRYATGEENINNCRLVADYLGLKNIEFFNGKVPADKVSTSDIITNSGFLRPLNESLLKDTDGSKTVIPLMFEAWEIRDTDIDINYCREREIKVAGTWENHPDILVFDAVRTLAVKMALEAGFEVYQNKIAIWGDEHFGQKAMEGFLNSGATEATLVSDLNSLQKHLSEVDFVFICDYAETTPYFGKDGLFEPFIDIFENRPVGVVHLYGNVDTDLLKRRGIQVYPTTPGHAKHMTFTLGHVGLLPIINLQCAGFKVAEEMLTNTISKLSQPITF